MLFLQRIFVLSLTLIGLVILTGCAGAPAAPPPAATEMATAEPTEMVTAEPTEMVTEEATEMATEEPTEMATEEATEMATAEPTEMVTEEATEMVTEEPTEMATEEATEMATAEPTEMATAEPTEAASERIELDFVTPLSTVEQVDDIESLLHDVEGIISIRGNEIGLTITYDPAILTPDDIRQQMSNIGYPVKP